MQLSQLEKRADESDRFVDSYLKCVYLRDRIGQTFEGLITAVVDFGCFVQIVEAAIDGLLHVDNLRDDEYVKDDDRHGWHGLRSKRRLRLGSARERDRHGGESGGRTDRSGSGDRARRPARGVVSASMSATAVVYGVHAVRACCCARRGECVGCCWSAARRRAQRELQPLAQKAGIQPERVDARGGFARG